MSNRKKWDLDRRTFIKGMGVTLGLPLLECMLPSIAKAANGKTQRLVWIYMPLGFGAKDYQDSGIYSYPAVMNNAISSIRADTTVVSNLCTFTNPNWPSGPTGNAHPNCFVPYVNAGIYADVSKMSKTYDQHIADLNLGSKIRSISMTPAFYPVGDISDLQCNTLSYTAPNQPVSVATDPKALFNQLFSGGSPGQVDQRTQDQLKRKAGILHYVMGDIAKVNAVVGKDDKIRIDEFLTGINDLEKKITASLGTPGVNTCQKPALADPSNYPTKLAYLYDIIYYAFQCDLTRVASLMHGIEGGTGINHQSFIQGLQSQADWHGMSHLTPNYQGSTGDRDVNYQDLSKVISYHQGEIVKFVTKLKNTNLPNGQRLLDECAVVWGSSMSNSETHDPRGLAFNIAGSANGALKTGANLNMNNNALVANLYLTLMQAFGSPATKIGNSSGAISGLRT